MTETKKPGAKRAPAKKTASSKTTTKKSGVKRPRKSPAKKINNGKRSWLKVIWSFSWKAGVALAAVLLFVGIYLDSVVKDRFDGTSCLICLRWFMPAFSI